MSVGYFSDLNEAKAYFTNERLITTAWDALTTDALKTKAVTNAYNRLYYSNDFSLPTYAAATADQLVILKKANAEYAYYLAAHLCGEDNRLGLQAQNVDSVRISSISENYRKPDGVPIPEFVKDLLDGFKTKNYLFITDIERDENENVNYDATRKIGNRRYLE